ncbi:hypothetical protein PAMP_013749 [Pampus punctatissimus]
MIGGWGYGSMVSDAVKEIGSSHTAMATATEDGKPVRVSAIHTNTALCVAVKQLEQGDDLEWCSKPLDLQKQCTDDDLYGIHEASLLETAATLDGWESTGEQDPGEELARDE